MIGSMDPDPTRAKVHGSRFNGKCEPTDPWIQIRLESKFMDPDPVASLSQPDPWIQIRLEPMLESKSMDPDPNFCTRLQLNMNCVSAPCHQDARAWCKGSTLGFAWRGRRFESRRNPFSRILNFVTVLHSVWTQNFLRPAFAPICISYLHKRP